MLVAILIWSVTILVSVGLCILDATIFRNNRDVALSINSGRTKTSDYDTVVIPMGVFWVSVFVKKVTDN